MTTYYCSNIIQAIDASEFGPGSTGVVVVCGTCRKCADCKREDAAKVPCSHCSRLLRGSPLRKRGYSGT